MNALDRRDEIGVGHKARPTREFSCGSGFTPDSGNLDCDQHTRHVGQVSDLPPIPTAAEGRSKTCPTSKPSRLWLWIVAAFVLQGLAWAAWFTIASLHPVEEVPVVRTQGR
jgi:hypothetical protein